MGFEYNKTRIISIARYTTKMICFIRLTGLNTGDKSDKVFEYNVGIWTGCGGDNWCGTSVEFDWFCVGSGVEMRTVSGNFQISVGTRCLWCVVEVGCAMEGRGRLVRGVCGN